MSVTAKELDDALELALDNPNDARYVAAFKKLMDAAADPNFMGGKGAFPGIVLATMNRRMDLLKVFLDNPKVTYEALSKTSKETALFFAAALKELPNEIPGATTSDFLKLLARNISLLHTNTHNKTVLTVTQERMQSYCSNKNTALQKSGLYLKTVVLPLLESLTTQELLNRELYQAVVVEQDIPKVKPLVERGANINWVNFETGNTCLIDLMHSQPYSDVSFLIVDSADELGLDFSVFGCHSPQAREVIKSLLDGYKLCDFILAASERECQRIETMKGYDKSIVDEFVREIKLPQGREYYLEAKGTVKLMLTYYIHINNQIRIDGVTPKTTDDLKQSLQSIKEVLGVLKVTKENYLKEVAQDHVKQTVKAVVKNGGYLGEPHSEQAVNRFRFHANPQNAMAANMNRPAGPAPVPPQRAVQQGAATRITTRVK